MEYDLIVVGGGPGGTSAATFVAKAGNKVLLLEKESFPRHQIGESLLPATIQGICQLLGAKEDIDTASFSPKRGGTFLWGKSEKPWTFLFEKDARPTAYQVERLKFDSILLNNAIKCGVDVKQSCKVVDLIQNNQRVEGVQYQDNDGSIITAKSKFVVDASGHKSTIYQYVGERIYSDFFRNSAIYGYFTGGKRLPAPNEGNILSAAFKQGWIWYIPLTADLTSVGIVVDHKYFRNAELNKENFFTDHIKQCPIVADYLNQARRATNPHYSPLRIRKDFSYTTSQLWTPGMALIGDAACFVDPVFSSGVHLATLSALFVARSINTCLKGLVNEVDCFREFEIRYRREYGNFYNFLIAFYDVDQHEEDYYWAARKLIGTKESGNKAFIKLVSGYSTTEGIMTDGSPDKFFSDRSNFGEAFQNYFINQQGSNTNNKINMSEFMKGLTKEIVNIQVQAGGYNLEELLQPTEGLIATPDALHWRKV